MIRKICIFLAGLLVGGFSAPPDERSKFAVEHKNAEQLLNEFAYNWTLDGNDVAADKTRQLDRISQSPYYMEADQKSTLETKTQRSLIGQLIDLYQLSGRFKDQLKKVLADPSCGYYVDEEFSLEGTKLRYSRLGFVQRSPGRDAYIFGYTTYAVDFPKSPQAVIQFLACEARYGEHGSKKSSCTPPPGFTRVDWLSFQIWQRANAITWFTVRAGPIRDKMLRQLDYLKAFLPATYRPMDRCSGWPAAGDPDQRRLDAMVSPKFGLALALTESANYSKMTDGEMDRIREIVNVGSGSEPVNPTLR